MIAEPGAVQHSSVAGNGHGAPSTHNRHRMTPCIAISVRDTGIGISTEDMAVIFEEFRQVRERRAGQRGSGLGLSITRKLIEAHGGRIWVESQPQEGTTFYFQIPRHA